MIAAHEVMMPFVLALLIAYVLTPLVAMAERRRVSRPVAILMVYVVVIGAMAGFVRGTAPRIAQEFITLRTELPSLAADAKQRWVPAIVDRLRSVGLVAPESSPPPEGQEATPTSAFVARPQPDGSLAIDVGTGVVVTETKRGWLVEPMREHKEEPFDPNRLVSDVVGKSFAYAQNNSLEIARGVRDLLAGVKAASSSSFSHHAHARRVPRMMTREHILGFFRSLVRPGGRASFDGLLSGIDRGLSGVVRGPRLICGIHGLLSAMRLASVGAQVLARDGHRGRRLLAHPRLRFHRELGACGGGRPDAGPRHRVLRLLLDPRHSPARGERPEPEDHGRYLPKIHPVLVIFAILVGEHFFQVVRCAARHAGDVDPADGVSAPERRNQQGRAGARGRGRGPLRAQAAAALRPAGLPLLFCGLPGLRCTRLAGERCFARRFVLEERRLPARDGHCVSTRGPRDASHFFPRRDGMSSCFEEATVGLDVTPFHLDRLRCHVDRLPFCFDGP